MAILSLMVRSWLGTDTWRIRKCSQFMLIHYQFHWCHCITCCVVCLTNFNYIPLETHELSICLSEFLNKQQAVLHDIAVLLMRHVGAGGRNSSTPERRVMLGVTCLVCLDPEAVGSGNHPKHLFKLGSRLTKIPHRLLFPFFRDLCFLLWKEI